MPSAESIEGGVAIIVAAYNAEATIVRAVASALAQPEVREVFVVDDASTDGTVAAARSADDGSGRLHVHAVKTNAGPAAARNHGLREASAEWIGVLDADDFLLPGRLAALLLHAANAELVADDLWQVDVQDPDGPRRALVGDRLALPRTVTFTEFVLSNVPDPHRQRAELGFIKPIMKRAFLRRHGLRYREDMRLGEDYDLYARALARGAVLRLLPAAGYISVVRPDSLSGRHTPADLLNLRQCDARLLADLPLDRVQRLAVRAHYLSTDARLQWRLMIEAVKQRNVVAFARTFLRPWPVPKILLGNLFEQMRLRWLKGRA